jgi:hypothetical protein
MHAFANLATQRHRGKDSTSLDGLNPAHHFAQLDVDDILKGLHREE